MVEWYEKLTEYFPEHEMKPRGQLEALIDDKDIYHKDETDEYLLLYAEFPTFIFIDYLLVNGQTRGKGTGSGVLERLKQRGKAIILEVEPVDKDDADTVKRANFYNKNGFIKADRIVYEREDEDGNTYQMKIYYWTPEADLPQEQVLQKMAKACEEIHNYRARRFYDRVPADPDEVLRLRK